MTRGVQVDLNLPVFQDDLFALEANDLCQSMKTFRKLRGLLWDQVYQGSLGIRGV